jgi:hypothetical protein
MEFIWYAWSPFNICRISWSFGIFPVVELSLNFLFRNIEMKVYETIILAAVFYGCGTWEERMLVWNECREK